MGFAYEPARRRPPVHFGKVLTEEIPAAMPEQETPAERPPNASDSGRERVSRAAYELFSGMASRRWAWTRLSRSAGTAKMTLYRNSRQKMT